MYNKTELMQAAKQAIAAKREAAVITAYNYKQRVYNALPKLVECDNLIINAGIELSRLCATGAQSETVEEKRVELKQLETERRALIDKGGFNPRLLNPQYSCEICKDTGTANGKPCECLKKQLQKMRRKEINASSALSLCSFDTFTLDKYSAEPDAELGASPREIMSANYDYCKKYAQSFDAANKNLFLMGDAGLGKTHLALSIANEVLDKGYDVIYVSAQNIFARLEKERFENGDTLTALCETDLLVLDDLGTEYITPYILSVIYDLVNTRMLKKRPTIYTTNILTQQLLNTRYTEKTVSRLLGGCEILFFAGSDIRLAEK